LARELSDETANLPESDLAAEVVSTADEATGDTQSDTAVLALWLLAGATAALLVAFLFHTSPRRRARRGGHIA
jgi:hypothetical protein